MRIVVTREELAACLPRAGRYRVRIQSVTPIPAERPVDIQLLLAVLDPTPLPTLIQDRFPIRDAPPESLAGMHRLLQLLHLAGVRVLPDTPLDLRALLGLELLVDVRREPGPSGFPYARVVGYAKPWRPSSCAAPPGTPPSHADGHCAHTHAVDSGHASPDSPGCP